MTTTAALILGAFLFLTMTAILGFLLLWRNLSSRTPSPTPTSTPEKPDSSEAPMVEVMKMMTKLVETMVVGREPTESQISQISLPEMPTTFDYDSTPLSPGIEAQMEREMAENEEAVLLKERAVWQKRLAELQAEEMTRQAQNGSEDSLPGPWSGPREE
jgi:hypothetical protein